MVNEQYALWLIPHGHKHTVLKNAIDRLAKTHTFTPFEPHVTLLSDLARRKDLESLSDALALSLDPFSIDLPHVLYGDSFFKRVHLTAITNKELLTARRQAEQMFETHASYRPHLSLVYGDQGRAACADAQRLIGPLLPLSVRFDGLKLVRTSDYPRWKEVASYALGGK